MGLSDQGEYWRDDDTGTLVSKNFGNAGIQAFLKAKMAGELDGPQGSPPTSPAQDTMDQDNRMVAQPIQLNLKSISSPSPAMPTPLNGQPFAQAPGIGMDGPTNAPTQAPSESSGSGFAAAPGMLSKMMSGAATGQQGGQGSGVDPRALAMRQAQNQDKIDQLTAKYAVNMAAADKLSSKGSSAPGAEATLKNPNAALEAFLKQRQAQQEFQQEDKEKAYEKARPQILKQLFASRGVQLPDEAVGAMKDTDVKAFEDSYKDDTTRKTEEARAKREEEQSQHDFGRDTETSRHNKAMEAIDRTRAATERGKKADDKTDKEVERLGKDEEPVDVMARHIDQLKNVEAQGRPGLGPIAKYVPDWMSSGAADSRGAVNGAVVDYMKMLGMRYNTHEAENVKKQFGIDEGSSDERFHRGVKDLQAAIATKKREIEARHTPTAVQRFHEQGGGGEKTVAGKKYSPSRNVTRITYSDGSTEDLNGRQ